MKGIGLPPLDPPHRMRTPLVVGLGEALFDCFPHGEVLGGAPINFALHAHALLEPAGGSAAVATRVGNDARGERFRQEIVARGLSTRGVQNDPKRPTGTVSVELDDSRHASYEFLADCAWDHLELTDAWAQMAAECDAVTFGTLAQRSPAGRAAIHGFLGHARDAVRVYDVNLRQQFFSAEIIEHSLRLATAVKLNLEELAVVCQLLDLGNRASPDVDDQAIALCLTFGLDWLAVTRGERGTLLFQGGERYEAVVPAKNTTAREADSVGAGDACCAGLVVGALLGWPPERTLDLANRIGAYVASQPGATPALAPSLLGLVGERAATG